MVRERQLSFLVSIGCIINELLHKLCISKAPVDPSKVRQLTSSAQWWHLFSNVTLVSIYLTSQMFKEPSTSMDRASRRRATDGLPMIAEMRRAMSDG